MLKSIGRDNLLIMLALLVWALGEGLWLNLKPLYLTGLGAGPEQVGTALAIGSIGTALALLPAGYGIDRVGPRQMMLVSWGLGVAGTVLLILAPTWQLATAALFVYGSSSFAVPAMSAYALLTARVGAHPGGAQGVLTLMFSSYPVGLIISPAVGGYITQHYGMQANMLVALGLFIVSSAIVLGTRHVDPPPSAPGGRIDSLLRNREYLWRAFFYAGGWLALLIGYTLIPNFLRDIRGVDVATIGLLYSLMSVGTVVISLGIGRLSLRWGYPVMLLVVWLAMLGLWLVTAHMGIAAAFFAFGGVYAARALAVAGLEKVVNPHERGLAFSALEMLFALANALSAALAGMLYKANSGHDLPLIAGAVMLPAVAAVWFAARVWRVAPLAVAEGEPAPAGD